jgi:hypothetical protein
MMVVVELEVVGTGPPVVVVVLEVVGGPPWWPGL